MGSMTGVIATGKDGDKGVGGPMMLWFAVIAASAGESPIMCGLGGSIVCGRSRMLCLLHKERRGQKRSDSIKRVSRSKVIGEFFFIQGIATKDRVPRLSASTLQ